MSTVGGSSIALWSANGMYWKIIFVLSLSKLAQPPFLHCIAKIQSSARCADLVLVSLPRIVDTVQRQQHLASIIHIRIKLIVELEVPAARLDVLHLLRPVALMPDFFREHPVRRLQQARIVLGTPASPSAEITCAVSHTGGKHGCIRKVGVG